MDADALRRLVERIILTKLAERGDRFVPAASSNRHIHLSRGDMDALFPAGYRLTKLRDLSQTGQYAACETVILETAKASLTLRVLGPLREETQAELSISDAIALGLPPVVRMSGDIAGSPGARLRNGGSRVELRQGVIVAARHIHMSPAEAEAFGLKDGDMVSLEAGGVRPSVFHDVAVRCAPGFVMEAHFDRDEANAAAIKDGALLKLIPQNAPAKRACSACVLAQSEDYEQSGQAERGAEFVESFRCQAPVGTAPLKLATEQDVRAARKSGAKQIMLTQNAIITPLARDMAQEAGIEFIKGGFS